MAEPRDDRAWPRGSFLISVVLGLAAAAAGVGLALGAADRGSLVTAVVSGGFVVGLGFGLAVYVVGIRQWLQGNPYPGRLKWVQLAGIGASVLVMYTFDGSVGAAMLAGVLGGMMLANAWAIRAARVNRGAVDSAEAADEAAGADDEPYGSTDEADEPSQGAPVGHVLRGTVALERQRLLAWLVAGAVATGATLAFGAPQSVTLGIVFIGAVALVWVARRLWAVWLALRDFTKAATTPRRAFVMLLHDPAPRMMRPLLAVWSDPPVPHGGRMPTPERVYRCDDEHDALECHQGSVVTHEAWVDTGPRSTSKPRWVAADAGMALPHRRSLFGRWYVSSLVGAERPGRPKRLTMERPHPGAEALVDEAGNRGSFSAALGWRLIGLAATGLLFYWLA